MDPALELEAREIARHCMIDETIARGDSPVQRFYEDAVVLVTGGTGFLGKQLIEKLLRSCNVQKIYIIIRPKNKKTIQQRIAHLAEDPVFQKLHKMQPDFEKKLVPIHGDVADIRMGVADNDWDTLVNEVTMIFHGAATILFTEPLKKATLTNVRGTREMLRLGKACKRLRSFIHTSTAFSHATYDRVKGNVEEQFYDTPIPPQVLIEMAETMDEEILDNMTTNLLKTWLNTYAFTKAAAEELVRTTSEGLPICIIRPAIVVAAVAEPSPGWIEPSCIYGATGLLLSAGLGAIHILYADGESNVDLVPVDMVNNATLAAAKATVDRREVGKKDIKIYTVTTTRGPLNFGDIVRNVNKIRIYTDKAVGYGGAVWTKNKYLFLLVNFVLHVIPAYIADFVFWIAGKKTRAVKLVNTYTKLSVVLSYFLTNHWIFGDQNLRKLYWNLSPADRIMYNFNTDIIEWKHYIEIWALGIRKYIIKDGLNNTKKGTRLQIWFGLASAVILPLYLYALAKIVYTLVVTLTSVSCSVFSL